MSGPAPANPTEVAARIEIQLRNFLSVLLDWHDHPDRHIPVSEAGRELHDSIETTQQAGLTGLATRLDSLLRMLDSIGNDPRKSNHGLQSLLRTVGEVRVEASITAVAGAASRAGLASRTGFVSPAPDDPTSHQTDPSTLPGAGRDTPGWVPPRPSQSAIDRPESTSSDTQGEGLSPATLSEMADLLLRLSQTVGTAVGNLRAALGFGTSGGAQEARPERVMVTLPGIAREDRADRPDELGDPGNPSDPPDTSVVCMVVDAGTDRFAVPTRAIRAALRWDPKRGRSIMVGSSELPVEPLGGSTLSRPRHPVIVARDNGRLRAFGADWMLGVRTLDLAALLRPEGPRDTDGTPLTVLCAWALPAG